MSNKYIVFKREEFEEWVEDEIGLLEADPPLPQEIEDAVVIRRQDMFAPSAFDAYAKAVAAALLVPSAYANDKTTETLRRIADYFHQQAELAWTTRRKIPD